MNGLKKFNKTIQKFPLIRSLAVNFLPSFP